MGSHLQPITWRAALVGGPCPFVSGTGSVPVEHLPAAPANQPHQIPLIPPVGQPLVSEGVPEEVGVDVSDPGLLPPALDDGADAWRAEWTSESEPQSVCGGGVGVPPPDLPKVPVERRCRLDSERT